MIQIQLKKAEGGITLTNSNNDQLNVAGFDPSDLLAGALAKCTESTVRRFAQRNEYPLEELQVRIDYDRDRETKTAHFKVHLEIEGDLTAEMLKKLHKAAEKSYIRRVLSQNIELESDILHNGTLIQTN